MKKQRLVYGVGLNDEPMSAGRAEGNRFKHDPIYARWSDMLMRCYSPRYQAKYPTYAGCTVVEEWKNFSEFKSWMVTQRWEGMHLDKDFLVPGNRVYGPNTCAFIPQWLNLFYGANHATRGEWPIGVAWVNCKCDRKFAASLNIDGLRVTLGRFHTPEEANQAYREAKHRELLKRIEQYKACDSQDPRVLTALSDRARELLANELVGFQ